MKIKVKWHSTNTVFPKKFDFYHVVAEGIKGNRYMDVRLYFPNAKKFFADNDVTHWAELPKFPED